MSDFTKYYKFIIEKHPHEVYGSYNVYDEDKVLVAKSIGYTIKKRFISFKSTISDSNYIISKREKNNFFVIKDDEIESVITIRGIYTSVNIRCPEDNVVTMHAKDFGSLHIYYNKDNIGLLSFNNWLTEDVGLILKDIKFVDYILAAIISMGYSKNTSPF